jgi:hypothetical protein
MQFVEHDAPERGKQKRRVIRRQQQGQLFGRGQQNVRRIAPLPLPPRHRRIAGAGFDLDRQAHLGDRGFQVARDVDRKRLQRRDVERVQASAARHAAAGGGEGAAGGQFHQRRQKTRERLAGAGRRDQKRGTIRAGLLKQRQLMRPRRPATRGKPAQKILGQQRVREKIWLS